MSNNAESETRSTRKLKEEKKQKTGYISWWLFKKKGTVAEPWPTAEELRDDPDVQNEIKMVKKAFAHTNTKQNG